MFPLSWAPDGRSVVFRTVPAEGGFVGIGVLPLVGERTPHLYRTSSTFAVSQAQVSPDGKWLTYVSGESGQYEAYIESFPNPGSSKRQISRNGGLFPRWRRDGRELFYLAFDGWLMAAPTASTASLEAGAPVALFEAHVLNGANILAGLIQQYDAARDGQRFLLNMPLEDADAAINVVLNWQEELKQRVPTR
jgi:hypothetical protein